MKSKVITLLIAMSLIFVLSCNKDETPVSNTGNVPTSPQSLSATPGNTITTLTWQAPSNGGSSAITNYNIYRGLTSGGQTFHKTVSGGSLSFIDSSLTNGTKYYYYVTALNSAGESNRSNEAFSTPSPITTVPSAPTNPTIISTNSAVNLSWNIPLNNGGQPLLGYKIYKGVDSLNLSLLVTIDSSNPRSYQDNNVINNNRYFYALTAFNVNGESIRTETIGATPKVSDTLSYSFNNFNDSILTINYAVGGTATSQMVSWSYPSVNLMKNPLKIRFNMTYITSGNMTIQLLYATATDTLRRQAFIMSTVKDSIRVNITGPANKLNLTPTNFMGRGTITVSK